ENDREPDPAQWAPRWGWLAGSLSDDGRSQESAALVEYVYSITRSARSRIDCGIVKPSALAVLRLITSSNLVDCSIGRSAGFATVGVWPPRRAGGGKGGAPPGPIPPPPAGCEKVLPRHDCGNPVLQRELGENRPIGIGQGLLDHHHRHRHAPRDTR